MIRLACKIPRTITIAVSGGPDSMSLLDFCVKGRKDITALYVNHRTSHGQEAQEVVAAYCLSHNINFQVRFIPEHLRHNELEWRNARLDIYKEFTQDGQCVATGATLDDAIEWLLLSTIHGKPAFMKPVDEQFGLIKPFLLTEKKNLIKWCENNSVPFIIDPTNNDGSNSRSVLRRDVLPHLLAIHPGLKTSIRRQMKPQ